jgi:uncharacterized protein YndB with AHSA1/START domain
MNKPVFVYVIYIAATAEKVFAALTSADMSEQYWTGNRSVSDWKVGSPWTLVLKRKEKEDITGKVLAVDPPRRLSYTFHPHHDGLEREGPSRVTFEIESQGDQVKLTLTHDEFPAGSEVLTHIGRGWPLIMSSLKSLLEAGRVLRAPWYEDEAKKTGAAA